MCVCLRCRFLDIEAQKWFVEEERNHFKIENKKKDEDVKNDIFIVFKSYTHTTFLTNLN